MSCCTVQAQKHTEPHSALKHRLAQSQPKTALSRNKRGHNSFPLMQEKDFMAGLETIQLTSPPL